MNRHFDDIDIVFISLIASYLVILFVILLTMLIQKIRRPAGNIEISQIQESAPKEHKTLMKLKKHIANIFWNIKNFKYHKLSFIKDNKFKKKDIMDKKVLSLDELIKDDNANNKKVKECTKANKAKRNVPKKKSKKKKKKRR